MLHIYIVGAVVSAIFTVLFGVGINVELNKASSEEVKQSNVQTQEGVQELGIQLERIKAGIESAENPSEVEEKYKIVAEKFYDSRDLRMAQEDARTARQKVEEIQKTIELKVFFEFLEKESEKYAEAYNKANGNELIKVTTSSLPKNIYETANETPAHILLSFSDKIYWAIRIAQYPDKTLAIQFVRLLSNDSQSDYEKMLLTNDSINLVIFKNEFGLSLNENISNNTKLNVIKDLSLKKQPLRENFETVSTEILKNVIEHALLSLEE